MPRRRLFLAKPRTLLFAVDSDLAIERLRHHYFNPIQSQRRHRWAVYIEYFPRGEGLSRNTAGLLECLLHAFPCPATQPANNDVQIVARFGRWLCTRLQVAFVTRSVGWYADRQPACPCPDPEAQDQGCIGVRCQAKHACVRAIFGFTSLRFPRPPTRTIMVCCTLGNHRRKPNAQDTYSGFFTRIVEYKRNRKAGSILNFTWPRRRRPDGGRQTCHMVRNDMGLPGPVWHKHASKIILRAMSSGSSIHLCLVAGNLFQLQCSITSCNGPLSRRTLRIAWNRGNVAAIVSHI